MRGLLSVLYGLLAYVSSLLTLLYLVAFVGDVRVPTTVDVGTGAPLAQALAIDLLLLAVFGIQHSLMARRGFKRWWTRVVPVAVERSTYLLASCAALALLFRFWVPIPTPVVWQVRQGSAELLLWTGFGLGWTLVLVSSFLIDHVELFGLRQSFAVLTRRAPHDAGFRTPLLYRHVRHPLYAGFLLSLWSAPVMTAGRLLLASGLSVYILVGIAFEERDLLRQFGESYRRYRAQVGMLVPRLRWPGAPPTGGSAAEAPGRRSDRS